MTCERLACALALLQGAFAAAGCDPSAPAAGHSPNASAAGELARQAVDRLYFVGSIAGALEPCGCQPNMLGGLDHAAALIEPPRGAAPHVPALVFAAGATFFQGSELQPRKGSQDVLKAQTIARSLADMQLGAYTPGLSDLAAGTEELAGLARALHAPVVAANLVLPAATQRFVLLSRAGHSIGVTGVVIADGESSLPAGVSISDAAPALTRALAELVGQRTALEIVLVSGTHDAAVELIERVPGFDLALVGEARARGDLFSAGHAPVDVGGTLILSPPSQLRAVSVVDLVARDGHLQPANPRTLEVDERVGASPATTARIRDYDARVAAMNRDARAASPELPSEAARYAGAERCNGCHDPALVFWNNTGHAHAYFTLVNRHKHHDLDCVGCHVTGYDEPGGPSSTQVSGFEAVQCEACHGPGAAHAKTGDPKQIVLTPERSLCRACHRPPHVRSDWDVETAWKAILGPGHEAAPAPPPRARAKRSL